MMAVLWGDIERDVADSRRHFGKARQMFERLRGQSATEEYYFQTGAFMHAMLAGYTSFEAGMKRLMALLGEPLPTGSDWHSMLLRRLAEPVRGMRPAVIDDPDLLVALNGLRGFRHVAAHAYDIFDEDRAEVTVAQAQIFESSIGPTLARFRAVIDPD